MNKDYRNTKYCSNLSNLMQEKNNLKNTILSFYPNAIDMHRYISSNSNGYKLLFMKAYNFKCAYCGVSIELLPKNSFQIDHFLCRSSSKFKTKKDSGYIENLVLACSECNHNKGDFNINSPYDICLHPDNDDIKRVFYRDDDYYIRVSSEYLNDNIVLDFYNKLNFLSEMRRLDYLLISLIGFQSEYKNDYKMYCGLGKIINILRIKRNIS